MNIKRYFDEAEDFVNDSYNNAGGSSNLQGSFDYDVFSDEGDFESANGMGRTGGAPISQPYILSIVNSTGAAVNASIFNSYTNRTAANFGNAAAITITSGITGVTYADMLAQSESKPFEVGLVYVNSANTAQVTNTVLITARDANGNTASKPMIPQFDPYQQITTVIALNYKFMLDGFTGLTISILANTTLTLSLYPSEVASLSKVMRNKRAIAGYSNPNIVRKQPLTLTNPNG